MEDRVDRPSEAGPAGAKAAAWKALAWAKSHEPEALRAIYAARRAAFVARLRLLAAWYGAKVEIDIAPDVRFGKDIAVTVWPRSNNSVRIGPGSVIGDRVLFFLNDGRISLGDEVEIRRDSVFMMWGGHLELAGGNVFSFGTVVHCNDSIKLGRLSSTNEYVTIVDSSHYFTEPEKFFYHNTKPGSIEIGFNSWLASKSTIARGAKIGDHCIVGGNSLVVGMEVPDGHLASGVPAQVVRALELPWRKTAPELVAASDPASEPRPRRSRKSTTA
jgi:acetyltransferase-like isoleucine patch superfamily enzyme